MENRSSENSDSILEKHRPYIELLAQVSNSCVFLAEQNVAYLYLSPNFYNFFGYDRNKLDYRHDNSFLERRIHPDDLMVLGRLQIRLLTYISELPIEKQTDYKHIFEFRVLGKDQKYVRVISQHQILEMSPNGNPIILGVVDISPDQASDASIRFRLMNIKTGEVIPFAVSEEPHVSLTKREMEILKMANEGMLSKEISGMLSISIHTVNRHRQNIMEKMEVDNLVEAINYSRKLCLLE